VGPYRALASPLTGAGHNAADRACPDGAHRRQHRQEHRSALRPRAPVPQVRDDRLTDVGRQHPCPARPGRVKTVLLIYGETDRCVPIEPSIETWRTALGRGPARLSVSRLPGCGHFPTLAPDPADYDETGPISPAYEQLLADWLRTAAMPI
jgi:pimeloyl-ACP methyl ester carboxylesterase